LDARLLERAIEIAVEAHRGQRDKAGAPYILHPLRVMAACDSIRARMVGILHDLIEDTDWTLERLEAEGFPTDVVEGVASVTKLPEDKGPENDRYLAFCRRAAAHPLGREVKLADLDDNMDVSRLEAVDDAARKRLERYRLAVDVIRAVPAPEVPE
jgi:(p)ppGpp synthase/HD superfamily hydrolase